jgi:3-oxoacyl-[acyl-carrier-protein] synthase-3
MTQLHGRIVSAGKAVPDRVLTNSDIEKILDTSDEWIVSRTGIKRRHVFEQGTAETASVLGCRAARQALEKAGLAAKEIDGVICATFTPDYLFPSTACCIAGQLGISGAPAFDISAACAGFVYGLTMANSLIVSGQCSRVLLVGVEIISKTLDWTDRTTAILFGDGAGAIILEACSDPDKGILSSCIGSDGSLGDILCMPVWGEKRFMSMKGSEVFKHAVRMMGDSVLKAVEKAGVQISDIDLLIPHQANMRIISSLSQHLGIPKEKVMTNLAEYGNTSSASIPIALEEAIGSSRVTPGKLVAFTALGGGVAYGSAIVRF